MIFMACDQRRWIHSAESVQFAGDTRVEIDFGRTGTSFRSKVDVRKRWLPAGIVVSEHPALRPRRERVDGHPFLNRNAGVCAQSGADIDISEIGERATAGKLQLVIRDAGRAVER